MLCSLTATAQTNEQATSRWSFYPRVGINFSKFAGDKIYISTGDGEGDTQMKSKFKMGYTLGAEAEYMFNESIGVSAGLLYQLEGSDSKDLTVYTSGNNQKTHYGYKFNNQTLSLPVLLVLPINNTPLKFKIGLQPSYLLNAQLKSTEETYVKDTSGNWSGVQAESGSWKDNCNSWFNRVALSVPIGASCNLGNLQLDVRYNVGLTHIYKYTQDNVRANSIQILLGYQL